MKILLSYDGSPASDKALNETFTIGKALGAEIVLLTVLEPMAHFTQVNWSQHPQPGIWEGGDFSSLEDFLRTQHDVIGAEIQRRAVELADRYAYPFERITRSGAPRVIICETAEQIGADLLVVGSRGLGVIQRMMLGSVSSYVVHNASCSVLVVRSEEDQELPEPLPTESMRPS